jgi:hypothetical protein
METTLHVGHIALWSSSLYGSFQDIWSCISEATGDPKFSINYYGLIIIIQWLLPCLLLNSCDILLQDDGAKFIKLLRALEAYAEGSSADPIIRRAAYLWNKLKLWRWWCSKNWLGSPVTSSDQKRESLVLLLFWNIDAGSKFTHFRSNWMACWSDARKVPH